MDRWQDKLQREQERMARHQERWARRQEQWARRQERKAQHGPAHTAVGGAIVAVVGVVFLLSNMGIVRLENIWQYWPVILIAFGFARLVDSQGLGSLIFGGALAGVGALILLQNLDILRLDWNMLWPAALIVWGLVILLRPHQWRKPWQAGYQAPFPANQTGVDPNQADTGSTFGVCGGGATRLSQATINLVSLFGGGRRQVDSQEFRGGEVTAIFGGYELDLRNAAITLDQGAVVEATAIFGGIEIKVPGTWVVEARGVGVFGGFTDETRPPRPGEVTKVQRLIVTGAGIFGGVVIKN